MAARQAPRRGPADRLRPAQLAPIRQPNTGGHKARGDKISRRGHFTGIVQSRLPQQQRSANVLFTYELTRQLELSHGGVGRTSFDWENPPPETTAGVAEPLLKTHEQGAGTVVYLASSQRWRASPARTSPTASAPGCS